MRIDPRQRRWIGLATAVLALLATAVLWQRSRLWRQLQSTALELEQVDLTERLATARAALDQAQIEELERAIGDARAGLEEREPEIERLRTERRALARREQQATRRAAARERQALRELIDDRDQRLEALHAGYEEARQELTEARFPVDQLQEQLAVNAPSGLMRLLPETVRPWLRPRTPNTTTTGLGLSSLIGEPVGPSFGAVVVPVGAVDGSSAAASGVPYGAAAPSKTPDRAR